MPKHAFISIPLDIPEVQVLKTEITAYGAFILTVERTIVSTTCHRCGRTITDRHGHTAPRLLPILGRPVYLRIRPKCFGCPHSDGHPNHPAA